MTDTLETDKKKRASGTVLFLTALEIKTKNLLELLLHLECYADMILFVRESYLWTDF